MIDLSKIDPVTAEQPSKNKVSAAVQMYHEGEYEQSLKLAAAILSENEFDSFVAFIYIISEIFIQQLDLAATTSCVSSFSKLVVHLSLKDNDGQHQLGLKTGFIEFCRIIKLMYLTNPADSDLASYIELHDVLSNMASLIWGESFEEFKTDSDYKQFTHAFNTTIAQLKKAQIFTDRDPENNTISPESKDTLADPKQYLGSHSKENNTGPAYLGSVSPTLNSLLNKLRILESMLEDKRLFESAIIYNDIQKNIIENFDPTIYFPDIFFPSFSKIMPIIKTINHHISTHSNSIQWKMAESLYKLDENKFMSELGRLQENDFSDHQFTSTDVSTCQLNTHSATLHENATEHHSFHEDFERD